MSIKGRLGDISFPGRTNSLDTDQDTAGFIPRQSGQVLGDGRHVPGNGTRIRSEFLVSSGDIEIDSHRRMIKSQIQDHDGHNKKAQTQPRLSRLNFSKYVPGGGQEQECAHKGIEDHRGLSRSG